MSNLNTQQQVFFVMYSVFWGATLGSLGRWKAFDTGRAWIKGERSACNRFMLSVVMMNLVPLLYLAFTVSYLNNRLPPELWKLPRETLAVLEGSFPAFAIFGIYRIWLFLIQIGGKCFYPRNLCGQEWKKRFPNLCKEEDLRPASACPNFFWGLAYIFLPWLLVCLLSSQGHPPSMSFTLMPPG